MTNTEIKSKFPELQTRFPDGAYWNHPVGTDNNPNSVTQIPCDHIHHNTSGSCGCNSYGGAIQCHGFARYMAMLIFNSEPGIDGTGSFAPNVGWTLYKNGESGYSDLIIEPGDIIRIHEDSFQHTAIVCDVVNNTVTVGEVWGSDGCKINWGTFNGSLIEDIELTMDEVDRAKGWTYDVLKKYATYITKPHKTIITFDATGGTCETTSENHVVGVPYESLPIPTRNNYTFIGWWPERNIQSKQHTEETIVNRNEAYTLYAHWGSERKFANVGASTSTIKKYLSMQTDITSSGVNVVVRTDDGDVTQRWLRSPYNPAALKTTLAPNFGLSINDSNNSCIIRQVPGNEEDALIVLEDNGNGIYKIKLHKNNLYLTADANSNNVYWNEDSNSNYQLWHSESEISSIKVLDTYKVNNMSCPNLSEYSDELKSAICCAANLASYYDHPNEYCGCNLAEAGAIGESEILWNEVPAVEFITKPLDNYPSRIRSEICAERPVLICCSNNSGSDKHWVLATGYSGRVSTDDNIYVDDPNGAQFMSLAESMGNNNMTKVVSIMYTKAK